MLRPPPLRPDDPIAVVAPASAPRTAAEYEAGLDRLRSLYDVRTVWSSGRERGYLAAPDADRAAALNRAVEDPAIRAIFCVRGGYGSLRLLPRLDWAVARKSPTLLVGYSDVTALHLSYAAQAGVPGLSGPVVTEWADLDDDSLASFRRLAEGDAPPLGESSLRPLRPGTATGPLLGGNLSVLTRLVGTPYAPDWTGAILVLEDVAEAPYRIDRMFAHLQHAGILQAVAGVVLGDFGSADDEATQPSLSLDAVIEDYLGDRSYPVATHLEYGHLLPRCSLPIGPPVSLTVSSSSADLTAVAPLVRPS